MQISVVIPTCDRKTRLLSLLGSLECSTHPFLEVIIVDSGSDRLDEADLNTYPRLPIIYLASPKSVCIQRNIGIQKARAPFVFLCDDDIEVPNGYIQQLVNHLIDHKDAGAISGLFLQKEKDGWTAKYPLRSAASLIWAFIFQLSIWGEIDEAGKNPIVRPIREYYRQKGNHISKAGWPVITDFTGEYFVTPLYSLGASLVRKDWLLQSPFDEVLDPHGMGDNYGVALGFPGNRIDVLNHAFVYHHRESLNRLQRPLQYFRRALALDYFISTREDPDKQAAGRPKTASRKAPSSPTRPWLLWSLTGKLLGFIGTKDRSMIRPALKAIRHIAVGKNPYRLASKATLKNIEPLL